MADAHASGACDLTVMEVQVLFRAPWSNRRGIRLAHAGALGLFNTQLVGMKNLANVFVKNPLSALPRRAVAAPQTDNRVITAFRRQA